MSLETGKPTNNESPESFREVSEKMRDVLFDEPSKENLSNILSLISVTKALSPDSRKIAIQYAVDHLKSWPDDLRLCNSKTEPSWRGVFVNGKDADLAVVFRALDLRRQNLYDQDKSLENIFKRDEIKNIVSLSLEDCLLDIRMVKDLMNLTESTKLSQLKKLNISHNNFKAKGVQMLIESNAFPDLEELDLSSNFIGTEGVGVLNGLLQKFSHLRGLNLSGNYIGEGLIQAAVESGQVYGLQKLNLDYSNLGPLDVDLLAKSKSFSNLKELSLGHNDIGLAGAESLACSEILSMEVKRGLFNQKVISEELARKHGITT